MQIPLLTSSSIIFTETCIKQDTDCLDTSFRRMAEQTSDIIKEKKIDVDKFKSLLSNLPIRNKKQHKGFLEALWPQIANATVNDVWFKLKMHWDFLNYTLLEHLVNTFGDKALQKSMEDYKKKLDNFRRKTRLCVFAEYSKELREDEALLKLKVKLNMKWEECTLQDLEKWKVNITQKLLLPDYTLMLEYFGPGCISVTWTVPCLFVTLLMETMTTTDTKAFREEFGIISMTIDDEQCMCCQSQG